MAKVPPEHPASLKRAREGIPPLMWLLGYRMELGAAGGWIGFCFELILGTGIFWWRLEKDRWSKASGAVRELAIGRA